MRVYNSAQFEKHLIILKFQEVYFEKLIFLISNQVGEGQDVYFECLSQANPPVCQIIKLAIITPFPDNIVHIYTASRLNENRYWEITRQVYKIQWLHDGYTVEGSGSGQVTRKNREI